MAERALQIGVDGRELLGQPTGVGRYLLRVLQEWVRDDQNDRISIVLHAEPTDALRRSLPTVRWIVQPAERAGTIWEQTALPRALAAAGAEVFFAAGYTAPLRLPCPFVVAIYDVSYFAHPEWYAWREGLRRRWLTKRAAQRAASVVTISEFSAGEIVRWLGIERNRIRLAPPGAPERSDSTKGPRERLVLFAGSLFTRRHIPDLLRGFVEVRRRVPEARLVLAGANRTQPHVDPVELANSLGIGPAVEWREYVSDTDLDRLYDAARAFAFLSDYEGFAMTPMEALAHGVPAVLLDTPASREVYGDGALLGQAAPSAIAEALVTLLTNDDVHASVLASGRARLAQLSWPRSAGVIRAALTDAVRRP
jgi:glycosyltransferase involved in cell wall biosynthesis